MTVDEALKAIGERMEEVLEENEDAMSWDIEIEIKKRIVSENNLESIFNDEDELENMYTYEMFQKDIRFQPLI